MILIIVAWENYMGKQSLTGLIYGNFRNQSVETVLDTEDTFTTCHKF